MTKPWYAKGLYFHCTSCGKCCTGAPGYVWLTQDDIEKISSYLAIPQEQFIKEYTRNVDGKIALLEDSQSYDCVFLKNKLCMIYPARPSQCQSYPFWPENLKDKKSWEFQKRYCEGIDHKEAKKMPLEEIEKKVQS